MVSVVQRGRANVLQRDRPRPSPGRSLRQTDEEESTWKKRGEIKHEEIHVMKQRPVNNRADRQHCSQACNHQLAEYLRLVSMLFIETVWFSLRLTAAMFLSLALLPFEGTLC